MITANFITGREFVIASGLWQYDYGQTLRIQGLDLPTAVEIHFALRESGGESVTRVGVTKDGVTDVVIPDSMLEANGAASDYKIYAFIYLTDDTSGETVRKIIMPVKSRPKPEAFDAPEDAELFREAIAAVNEAVENAEEVAKTALEQVKGFDEYVSNKVTEAETQITKAKDDAVNEVSSDIKKATDAADTAVNAAKFAESAKTEAVQAIRIEGDTQIQNIEGTATEKIAEIGKKGAEVLDSIPENYVQMQNDVTANREQLRIKSSAIVQTATGTAIVAQDSSDDPARGLRMFGRTEQVTTTGKNLFNPENVMEAYFREEALITMSSVARMVYASCLPDTTYTISKTAGARFFVGYTSEIPASNISVSGVINNNTASAITITTGSDAVYLVAFIYLSSADTITVEEMLASVQIELGDTATDWEPYTGGIPSPNPDYPQELVSVGDNGSVEVGVYGKNLIDVSVDNANTKNVNGITYEINANGEVIANGTSTDISYIIFKIELLPNTDYILNGCPSAGSPYLYSVYSINTSDYVTNASNYDYGEGTLFNTGENTKYQIRCRIASGVTVSNLKFRPMLRLASIEDDIFEPYTKQSLTVLTPNGLPGIPVNDESLATYTDADGQMWCADEIDFERGVYVQRVLVIEDLKSLSNFNAHTPSDGSGVTVQYDTGCTLINTYVYCTHYLYCPNNWHKTNNTMCVGGYVLSKIQISVSKDVATTGNEFKEFINNLGEPIKVLACLATPIETPLTESELAAYQSLHSNYPVTTVLNDANAHMEFSYNADPKNYIAAEHAKMEAAFDAKLAEIIALLPAETQAAMIDNETTNLLNESEE